MGLEVVGGKGAMGGRKGGFRAGVERGTVSAHWFRRQQKGKTDPQRSRRKVPTKFSRPLGSRSIKKFQVFGGGRGGD